MERRLACRFTRFTEKKTRRNKWQEPLHASACHGVFSLNTCQASLRIGLGETQRPHVALCACCAVAFLRCPEDEPTDGSSFRILRVPGERKNKYGRKVFAAQAHGALASAGQPSTARGLGVFVRFECFKVRTMCVAGATPPCY